MSGKWKFAVATMAAAAAASGVVLAAGAGPPAAGDAVAARAAQTVPVHLAGARSGPSASRGAAGAKASRHRIGLAFFQTNPVRVPTGRTKIKIGPTPRKCRTINGYYFVRGEDRTKIASEGDSPARHRFWKFYRNNRTGSTIGDVVYGVVCIRGLRLIR